MNALLHLLTILKIFGPSDSDTEDDEKSGDEKPKK